jgi:hypothetical protein
LLYIYINKRVNIYKHKTGIKNKKELLKLLLIEILLKYNLCQKNIINNIMMIYLGVYRKLMMRNKLFRLIIRYMNNGYKYISNDILFF